MRSLLFILFLAATSFQLKADDGKSANPLAKYSKEWNDPKYQACNTAKNTAYLSAKEREVMYVLNMARVNPKLFCKTVVSKAYAINGADTAGTYYKSLVQRMMTMKPLKILQPDPVCFKSAHCHAATSGPTGYTGHERHTPECRKVQRYNGECCHYGKSVPVNIILSLLIDQDVVSLGHRNICFTDYNKMAPSIQPHKGYGWVTVIDFLF